jgi:adenosylcobinamide-GDP ribazoletransferase
MSAGLRLAFTTLTTLPVRGPNAVRRQDAGVAMRLAPAVGLVLGLALALLLSGVDRVTAGPSLLGPALVLAALALLTRGLHLDGLADLADGLGSYAGPERARAVMKQPDVGALGVAAVVLVLLVQFTALCACVAAGRGPAALVLATTAGRLVLVPACTTGVRPAGELGLGALVAETVGRGWTTALAVLTALVGVGALAITSGTDLLLAPAAVAVALLVARVVRRHAVGRLGGITGDVLGALIELATTAVLLVMAIAP